MKYTSMYSEFTNNNNIYILSFLYNIIKKLRKGTRHRQIITCLSRLLVISANNVSVRQAGGQRKHKQVDVISVWEFKFKSEKDHPVAWEWVKIAQVPSSFREEWMVRMKGIIKYFPLTCFYEMGIKLNFIFILLKLKIDKFT